MSIAPTRSIPTYPAPGETSDFEVTYDDYLAMPESNQHIEVVGGVIYVMAGPTVFHQIVTRKITSLLVQEVEPGGLGLVLPSPFDVIIRRYPKLCVRQPDVIYYSNAKAGLRVTERLDLVQDGTIPPNLVVEVLSPGQNEKALSDKLADYASLGVEEVWFADQATSSIRVLARDGDGYRLVNEYKAGDRLQSAVLPGLELDVSEVLGL